MQKLLIVIFLALNCSQHVESSFFGLIAQAFEELTSDIVSFFSNVKNIIVLASMPRHEQTGERFIYVSRPVFKKRENDHAQPESPREEAAAVRLAAAHGRALHPYRVYTQDGYILTLHRLLRRAHGPVKSGVVFLHHGLLGSSADWILQGPGKSLPYLLSDAGYDVWLANSRGNYYSRTHLFKSPNTVAYWDFSWQDIGEKDLPAIFDYITTVTGCTEGINYIGHGMGATALLVLLSVKPEYNEYVRIAVLLAPLAIMKRTRGPLHDFALSLDDFLYTSKEYFPTNQVPETLSRGYCQVYDSMCRNSLLFFTGVLLQKNDTDTNFIPLLFYHVPAGGSEKTMQHYAELVVNQKFHKFGNGDEEFPLDNINASIAIFSSSDDWLSDVYDNSELYSALPNAIGHVIIQGKKVSHTEFVWGYNAYTLIFNKVIDLIQNGTKINEVK